MTVPFCWRELVRGKWSRPVHSSGRDDVASRRARRAFSVRVARRSMRRRRFTDAERGRASHLRHRRRRSAALLGRRFRRAEHRARGRARVARGGRVQGRVSHVRHSHGRRRAVLGMRRELRVERGTGGSRRQRVDLRGRRERPHVRRRISRPRGTMLGTVHAPGRRQPVVRPVASRHRRRGLGLRPVRHRRHGAVPRVERQRPDHRPAICAKRRVAGRLGRISAHLRHHRARPRDDVLGQRRRVRIHPAVTHGAGAHERSNRAGTRVGSRRQWNPLDLRRRRRREETQVLGPRVGLLPGRSVRRVRGVWAGHQRRGRVGVGHVDWGRRYVFLGRRHRR